MRTPNLVYPLVQRNGSGVHTPVDDSRISVVIPTYNREALITRAIRSALEQTRPPAEIIVIDDGSTDNSRGVIEAFGSAVWYRYQENAGASEARNHGVRIASSRWIAFLDSDDVWSPTYLERIADAIRGTEGRAGFYFTNVDESATGRGPDLWTISGFSITGQFALTNDASDWVMREFQPMLLPFTVFQRDAFLGVGGLWTDLSTREDTHLFMRLGLGGAACAVASCGGKETNDELPSNRLSIAHGSDTAEHWHNSIRMYHDILGSGARISEYYRTELVRRLADSHWRLSRLAWKDKDLRTSFREACRSFNVDSGTFLDILVRGFGLQREKSPKKRDKAK